ncbi:MAG: protein kinase domain-containing protein, partial [Actinomycetota bacterium]
SDALDYAHRNGVHHRDVKPANVLLTHDSIKVADFGIAKAAFATGDITTTGSILGTVTYISPEQAQGKEPDARSDLYALGIVLYELLVGRPPFQEATQMATVLRHVHDPPPAPRSLKAGIPRALDTVLLKALAKDPDARFASAVEMRNALISATAPATVSLRTTGAPARTPPPRAEPQTSSGDARWIVGVLAIVAAAVVLALAIPALLGGPDDEDTIGRPGNGAGDAGGLTIQVDEVTDLDPYGSSGEHPEDTHLAADGDPATAWGTQTYDASFEVLNKAGVGLVFDLGSPKEVAAVELQSPQSGYDVELLADDAPGDFETDFDQIAAAEDVSGDEKITFEPTEFQYWVVWITSLPGGGAGSMELSEVTFLAP